MAIERSVLEMRPNNRKWPMSWKKKNTVGGGGEGLPREEWRSEKRRTVGERGGMVGGAAWSGDGLQKEYYNGGRLNVDIGEVR